MSRATLRWIAPFTLVIFILSGCASVGQTVEDNPKASLGGAMGAAGGGLIAAAAGGGAAGIVGGVLVGGLLGGAIGNALDQRDKELAMQAANNSLESTRTGQTSTWHNPDSGNSGNMTPTRTYQGSNGEYCREYEQEILVGGEKHQSYGAACRQPDGSWKTVD